MKIYSSMVVVALIGLLTSCGSGKATDTADSSFDPSALYNKTWHLDKIDGKAVNYTNENGKWPSLILDDTDNGVSGFAGCNNFMGNFETDGKNQLEFSKMASTRMACPHIDFNENGYLKLLEEVRSYQLAEDVLKLQNKKGKTLLSFSVVGEDSSGITEKYWKLKTFHGKEVKMNKNQEQEVHFILKDKDHKIQGFSGCNTFMGSYDLKGGNVIKFSQMAGTLKACPDLDFNENDFLRIFEEMDHYKQDGDILQFLSATDEVLATFEAVYF